MSHDWKRSAATWGSRLVGRCRSGSSPVSGQEAVVGANLVHLHGRRGQLLHEVDVLDAQAVLLGRAGHHRAGRPEAEHRVAAQVHGHVGVRALAVKHQVAGVRVGGGGALEGAQREAVAAAAKGAPVRIRPTTSYRLG